LNDPNLRIDELEAAIRQDLSLSYKLLKFVGSASCAARGQIHSIRHAAVLAGIDRLKIWAALILFSGIEEKMKELAMTAVVRARVCEKLAEGHEDV
jgi:EAL and modified HD-GYP domain-containing signal transduction protein